MADRRLLPRADKRARGRLRSALCNSLTTLSTDRLSPPSSPYMREIFRFNDKLSPSALAAARSRAPGCGANFMNGHEVGFGMLWIRRRAPRSRPPAPSRPPLGVCSTFPDPMHELDPGDRDRRAPKSLEPPGMGPRKERRLDALRGLHAPLYATPDRRRARAHAICARASKSAILASKAMPFSLQSFAARAGSVAFQSPPSAFIRFALAASRLCRICSAVSSLASAAACAVTTAV